MIFLRDGDQVYVKFYLLFFSNLKLILFVVFFFLKKKDEIMNYDPDAVQPTAQELEEISKLMSQQTLEQCIQSLKESQNIFVQVNSFPTNFFF